MNYDAVKAEVMRLHPAQVQASKVVKASRRVEMQAYVNWDAGTAEPSGSVESFAEVVYTLLSLCETEQQGEWMVLGDEGAVVVRMLSKFVEAEGLVCWPTHLVYIGQLGRVAVYFDKLVGSSEFFAGGLYRDVCGRGSILNGPPVGRTANRMGCVKVDDYDCPGVD